MLRRSGKYVSLKLVTIPNILTYPIPVDNMLKRILLVFLCSFLCIASFAQRSNREKAAKGNTLYSASFDAMMISVEWATIKDVNITMSVFQPDKKNPLWVDKDFLDWQCMVVGSETGETLLDFEAPGTLGSDYKEDGHFYVVSAGSAKYRMVVDMNNLPSFIILETGTNGAKASWLIEPASSSARGTQWIDRYLCWALYSNSVYVTKVQMSGGPTNLLKKRIAFIKDIVSDFPDGVMKDREQSFVTPLQLAGRLEDHLDPSAYTRPMTTQEKGPTWKRFSQLSSDPLSAPAVTKEQGDMIIKQTLAQFFKTVEEYKAYKELSELPEMLKTIQAPPFPSSEYLRKMPGTGWDYTILEMLQHPFLLFPTFTNELSMKDVRARVKEAFPQFKRPSSLSSNTNLRYEMRDVEATKRPRIHGTEVESLSMGRISKNIWELAYRVEFNTKEKAEAFLYDICAELAYAGFKVYHDKYGFHSELKIPDGKKTRRITYSFSLDTYRDNLNVIHLKGINYRY